MRFKTKIRKVGNSYGVLIPKDIVARFSPGEDIELDVITNDNQEVLVPTETVKSNATFNTEMCSKHPGSYKGTCGCK